MSHPKLVPTTHPVHDLIARRWSPDAFADRMPLAAQRAVARGLAPANLQQQAPHGLLECRAARQVQRQVKVLALSGQVLLQLVRGLLQHGVMAWPQRPGARAVQVGGGLVALAFKPDARQAGGGGGQPHGPQRGVGPCLQGEGVKLHENRLLLIRHEST